MALVADRVKESSTTTGTGTLTLAGAPSGYRTFSAAFGNGVSVYYVIEAGAAWEIGLGTTGAGTLTRDTVLRSSNADALVDFAAGDKTVFCAYVADRAVTTSDAATLTNKVIDDVNNLVGADHLHYKVKATTTIAKGQVLKAVGYQSGENAIEVAPVSSASDVAVGIAYVALNTGEFGPAIHNGLVVDVKTDYPGWAAGDILYPDPSTGGLTKTKPTSGTYQACAYVMRVQSQNGVLLVEFTEPEPVAASTNTANTVVARDGSGNFAAGTITADTLVLPGATSGAVTVQPAADAGTWSLTLPTSDGDSGQVLTTDGAGVTSWATVPGQFSDQSITPSASVPYEVDAGDVSTRLVIASTSGVPIVNFLSANTSGIATGARVKVAAFSRTVALNAVYSETLDPSFNPDVNGTVETIVVQPDGKVLIGGSFTTVGGVTRNRLARLNADGSLDESFDPNVLGAVYALALQADGKIVLGGVFTSVGGSARNRIARINADGTLDTTFNPNSSGTVWTLAMRSDNRIMVGGSFLSIGGLARDRIACLNTDGTALSTFSPSANNVVYRLAVLPNDSVVIGGEFTAVNAIPKNYITRLTSAGSLDGGFSVGVNGTVWEVVLQPDGKLLVGGSFTQAFGGGTFTRNRIVRFNADGATVDSGFNPDANNTVLAIAIEPDGGVLFGGNFTTIGGTARNRLARVNASGTLDATFDPNVNGTVETIAVQSTGQILVGGQFTSVSATTRNRLARLGVLSAGVSGGDTIVAPSDLPLPLPLPRYSVVTLEKIATDTWCVTESNLS